MNRAKIVSEFAHWTSVEIVNRLLAAGTQIDIENRISTAMDKVNELVMQSNEYSVVRSRLELRTQGQCTCIEACDPCDVCDARGALEAFDRLFAKYVRKEPTNEQ